MNLRVACVALALSVAVAGAVFADDYPNGCVSCHAAADMTVGAMLEGLGHKNVSSMVETIPTDCTDCHSEDGGFGGLWEFIHPAHFAADSKFMSEFGGDCRHCHSMDADSGEAAVKSGDKNW